MKLAFVAAAAVLALLASLTLGCQDSADGERQYPLSGFVGGTQPLTTGGVDRG